MVTHYFDEGRLIRLLSQVRHRLTNRASKVAQPHGFVNLVSRSATKFRVEFRGNVADTLGDLMTFLLLQNLVNVHRQSRLALYIFRRHFRAVTWYAACGRQLLYVGKQCTRAER